MTSECSMMPICNICPIMLMSVFFRQLQVQLRRTHQDPHNLSPSSNHDFLTMSHMVLMPMLVLIWQQAISFSRLHLRVAICSPALDIEVVVPVRGMLVLMLMMMPTPVPVLMMVTMHMLMMFM
ncbi:hypothetical protein NM688_g8620 [Phlebia brevispora]|uniref:Uncharacterized protein n=1 Tax=Phlebia brevispora TaxID=194682 RepID=A0ACC1RSC6_9APHY|nr:hypothetical protein NM688_g8620 [Phlebia brevispora]